MKLTELLPYSKNEAMKEILRKSPQEKQDPCRPNRPTSVNIEIVRDYIKLKLINQK